MYQEFYKLKAHPFRLSPDPAFICMTEQHREALSGLIYSVCTHPGLSVLIGEAGTGKTTILYTVVGLLERRQYVVAMCSNPTLTREEFYEFVLLKFGVNCPSSKTRQLMALEEALTRYRAQGRHAVLIVDEAQRLPMELLEEIRLLLNLETPHEKLLEIVLAGQPELDVTLRRQELRQFKQRVGCLCTLRPLTPEEIGEYMSHRLAQAGLTGPSMFSEAAIEAIYAYSNGIPRLINILSDTALRTGFALQAPVITPFIVGEAAKELHLDYDPPVESSSATSNVVAALDARLRESALQALPPEVSSGPQRMPLESYTNRQKSLGFFSEWMGRWK